MQIVLSGNRVIAYGENCFLAMGGTVVCEETGKAYQNATIAEVEAIPSDVDSVGYEYHAGVFIPCAPYGKTEGGYMLAACYECGTPRYTDIAIEAVRDRLNTYATIAVTYPAGAVCTCSKGDITFTAPDTSGAYSFNVPEAGDWVIAIAAGTETASRTETISSRWQYKTCNISFFETVINVDYPEGHTCTCSNGSTTLTAPDTSGAYSFNVPEAGEWTIASTDGETTFSDTVEVTENGQVIITGLGFPVYTYSADDSFIEDSAAGDWRHKFLSSGTLNFSKLGNAAKGIDIFLVGGGGAGGRGGSATYWACGGSGGYNTLASFVPQKNVDYSIVIGAGGTAPTANNTYGDGGETTAFGFEAAGGGGGGNTNQAGNGSIYASKPGGSGGGGLQGNGGSNGSDGTGYGAGKGEGVSCYEFREESSGVLYCGGGAGALAGPDTISGGVGGGGAANKGAGEENTGGGGGGSWSNTESGGNGGSGIVIIRNKRG